MYLTHYYAVLIQKKSKNLYEVGANFTYFRGKILPDFDHGNQNKSLDQQPISNILINIPSDIAWVHGDPRFLVYTHMSLPVYVKARYQESAGT